MNTNKIYIIIIIVLISTLNYAQEFVSDVSKRGTTAASFLSIAQGARASSMGSAFVAVADDQSALYWNPAGLVKLPGVGFVFDHTEWLTNVKYNFLAGSYNLGDYGVVGLSFTSSSYGDMKVTTVNSPEGTGELFTASDVAVSIGYALRLTDNFAIGINPKLVYQSIWKTSATAVAFDVGVQYVTPFDGIVLGMAINNFGGKMQLEGNTTLVLYDPDPSGTGNNGNIPANLQTDEWALPLNFRVGMSYKAINTEAHKVTFALDAMHPNDNYESVNVGAEYVFNDAFSIRGGYKSLFLKDTEEGLTLGVGIKQLLLGNINLRVDYSYCDFGKLKNVQKFSFAINF